jgi:Protein of unknown function (DUF4242)
MPRYVVERFFDKISDEEMLTYASRSDELIRGRFESITWDHSHICVDDTGAITTFCVYEGPDEETIREHAEAFGGHTISRIYEIADEVTPADVRARAATRATQSS